MQLYKPARIIILVALFLSACSSPPQIPELPASYRYQSDSLNAAVKLAEQLEQQLPATQILVVFDIDNTLLAMNTELGSNQWYY